MIYHDIKQNTEDWYTLRFGKATSSNFAKIAANEGKPFGKPAIEYALKTVLESISMESVTDSFSNGWMEQGHEREPVAALKYEDEPFNTVLNGGFCQHEKMANIGCSPDGLVFDDNGGIEIKCPKFSTHYATLKRNSFDPTYKWQLIGNMWICELDWIDFVSYCPEFPKNKELFIHRLDRNDYIAELKYLEERVGEFRQMITKIESDIINNF